MDERGAVALLSKALFIPSLVCTINDHRPRERKRAILPRGYVDFCQGESGTLTSKWGGRVLKQFDKTDKEDEEEEERHTQRTQAQASQFPEAFLLRGYKREAGLLAAKGSTYRHIRDYT